ERAGEEVLRARPDVRIVGWVPSVAPYLQRARMSVIPLLHGAGTKRKLIQSLMFGTPAVTTSVGAEGLDLDHGEHALIADDAGSFADGVARLAVDDALWDRLSPEGRSRVGSSHGHAGASNRLMAAVTSILERPVKARPVQWPAEVPTPATARTMTP